MKKLFITNENGKIIAKKSYSTLSEENSILAKKYGVGLNEGATFGESGKGFQRLNFACSKQTLTEGLVRIIDAIEKK